MFNDTNNSYTDNTVGGADQARQVYQSLLASGRGSQNTRIVLYDRGYAIQRYKSGPYWNAAVGEWQ